MATGVYIDGFNLFYGCVKGTPYKWLNLERLARELLRGHNLYRVKYFTARVDDRPDDPRQSVRQDLFLSALDTLPLVETYLGHFRTRTKPVRLTNPPPKGSATVLANVTEEKGSDVNLASHLLWDAFHRHITCALVISNDSDLQTPVDMARELGLQVITANPHKHRGQAQHLHGDGTRTIKRTHLARSQFPETVLSRTGSVLRRPDTWR